MNPSIKCSARFRLVLLLCSGVSLGGAAWGQTSKPGLWEIQQQMQLDPAQQKQMDEARKELAALPPAQRKQFEDMMAKSGMGVDLASGGSKVKLCLTPEDAARESAPIDKRDGCTYEQQRKGATTTIQYRCTQPPSKGVVEVTTLSAERYTMKMTGTDGKSGQAMAMKGEGRWLSTDCGALKPLTAPRP